MSDDNSEKLPIDERSPIDERIKELKEQNPDITPTELVNIIHSEGYRTTEMMKHGLQLRLLAADTSKKKPSEPTDTNIQTAIAGYTKGKGYVEEFQSMVRAQISKSKEFTEFFYSIGMGVLLGGLNKSGMTMDEFRKIALEENGLRAALARSGETAFKALEYYQSDLITKVETERDEARAAYVVTNARLEELAKGLTPGVRLERMITAYLLSGDVTAEALSELLDRWLNMEQEALRKVITA